MTLPRTFQPETGINITCLTISAAAPMATLGLIGIPLGLVAAFALVAVMGAQKSPDERERKQAYVAVWLVRLFVVCIEQMAYQIGFSLYASGEKIQTLPFDWSVETWAWLAVIFMGLCDLWAYARTAARARVKAENEQVAADLERADERERERMAAKERERQAEINMKIRLAEIEANAETAKVAASVQAQTEARKIEAESRAETERIRAETENARAERGRKEAESRAEATRKQAEARAETERKQAEEGRKRAELARKEAEARAETIRQEAEIKRKAETAQRLENERIAQELADRTRKETEGAESTRKHWAERAETGRKGSPETKRKIVEEAERELRQGGKAGTRAEVAGLLGVSDKTVRNWANRAGEAA